jgi:hypothetical protein
LVPLTWGCGKSRPDHGVRRGDGYSRTGY